MKTNYLPAQAGAALITALLVLAIVAAIANDLISRAQLDIHRTGLFAVVQQADLDTTYSLAWAQLLYKLQVPPPPTTDGKVDTAAVQLNLPAVLPLTAVKNASIEAILISAQGRFNLNNLATDSYVPIFAKLIQTVATSDAEKSTAIAKATAYFLKSQINPQAEQAYATFIPSYQPSHRNLVSPSELRLVQGVTNVLYEQLEPYIIALPQNDTPIDPVAASAALLSSYGLTPEAVSAISHYLDEHHSFNNLSDFYTLAKFRPDTGKPLFDLKSQYFLLRTLLYADNLERTVYSILQIDKTNAKLAVIQQSRTTL